MLSKRNKPFPLHERGKIEEKKQSQEPTKNLQYQYIAGPFRGKASGLTTTPIMEKNRLLFIRESKKSQS